MNGYHGEIKLLTGTNHQELAKRVAKHLGISLVKTTVKKFGNSEIYAKVEENVRGQDVFYLSSLYARAKNNAIIETLLLIDCIKSSAGRITGVFPWLSYTKQDRRNQPREARSFLTIAKTLSDCGLHRVVLFDLHNQATADFFSIPNDHVYLMRLLIEEFNKRITDNVVIAGPDIGSGKRADAVARLTNQSDICIVWKVYDPVTKKLDPSKSRILGDVEGRDVWIFDDMIQSFGTLEIAIHAIKKAGAKKITVAAVHPDFTPATHNKPSALERIANSEVDEVIVVDTIPKTDGDVWPDKITVIDPAPFIGNCIERLHLDSPLSPLFLQY